MDWIQALGWGGSVLLVWSLVQTRILRLRVWNLVGCIVLIVFNATIQVWPMVGLNVMLALINLWYLRKLLRTRHDDNTFEVVEVGVNDEFLAHTLRVHGTDIARFNPTFTWYATGQAASTDTAAASTDTTAPTARTAFLVVAGDETVGVVVIRPDDVNSTIARVELDYVTPRFRDFTPGEFVYRRSQLFADRGFRTVISPPDMVAPYYARLGFRRTGDSYTLDVVPADGSV